MITVTCECGAKLRVKDELVGKKGKCPKCAQIITLVQQDLQIDDAPAKRASPPASGGTDKRTCPGCGARIPALSFSCEFCGATLRGSATASLASDTSPVGNSPEELVNRFAEAVGNMSAGIDAHESKDAQRCRSILTKLRIFAMKDANLRPLIDRLQQDFDHAVAEAKVRTKKDNKAWIIVGIVLALIFGSLFGYAEIIAPMHDAGIRQDIQRLVDEGRFGEARIRASDLWSSPQDREKEVKTLIESIDKAERAKRP